MSDKPQEVQACIYIPGHDDILISPDEARDLYAQLGDLLGMTGEMTGRIDIGEAWERAIQTVETDHEAQRKTWTDCKTDGLLKEAGIPVPDWGRYANPADAIDAWESAVVSARSAYMAEARRRKSRADDIAEMAADITEGRAVDG